MSNSIKSKPNGIDINIQKLQTFLYNQLLTKWGLNDATLAMYGRAYRNQTDDGFLPEVYEEKGTDNKSIDYKEVLFNDHVAASSFFGVGETQKYLAGSTTVPVYMIFMVDLKKIKPNLTWRADEEARLDVQNIVAMQRYGFKLVGFETGIDTVFKEYSGARKRYGIKYRDQQPTHCFRVNFTLLYDAVNNINC